MTPTPDPQAPVQQIATSTVYRNRWMTVREDQVRRLDKTRGIYGVVDKPDFALIIPEQDGGFHMITQFRYPNGEHSLEFPQGTSETDPLQGEALAQAELTEELGLRANHITLLGSVTPAPGTIAQRCHVWLATDLDSDTSRQRDPEEQDLEGTWVTRRDLEQQIRSGTITDGATIAAYTLYLLAHRS